MHFMQAAYAKGATKEQERYQLYETQDKLILFGIELICAQITRLMNVTFKYGIDLNWEFKTEQKKWQKQILKNHKSLVDWEL